MIEYFYGIFQYGMDFNGLMDKQVKESGSVNRPDYVYIGRQCRPFQEYSDNEQISKLWVEIKLCKHILWVDIDRIHHIYGLDLWVVIGTNGAERSETKDDKS